MTLSDLKTLVDHAMEHLFGEQLEVVIQTQNGGCPHRYMAKVINAQRGFDWTAPFFIIRAEDPIVVVNEIGDVHALARERLDALKASHATLGFKYIAKSREQEWLDGFVEGIRTHATAVKS